VAVQALGEKRQGVPRGADMAIRPLRRADGVGAALG